jgi:hypothetical protein
MPTDTKPISDKMWAISGRWANGRRFFYWGVSGTRRGAIEAHTSKGGRTWEECRDSGDRAVRVVVTELPRSAPKQRSKRRSDA